MRVDFECLKNGARVVPRLVQVVAVRHPVRLWGVGGRAPLYSPLRSTLVASVAHQIVNRCTASGAAEPTVHLSARGSRQVRLTRCPGSRCAPGAALHGVRPRPRRTLTNSHRGVEPLEKLGVHLPLGLGHQVRLQRLALVLYPHLVHELRLVCKVAFHLL